MPRGAELLESADYRLRSQFGIVRQIKVEEDIRVVEIAVQQVAIVNALVLLELVDRLGRAILPTPVVCRDLRIVIVRAEIETNAAHQNRDQQDPGDQLLGRISSAQFASLNRKPV